MPSITAAPLTYTPGVLRSSRIKPARLRFTAGNVSTSKDTLLSTAVETPVLDRLQSFDRLVMEGGTVDARFQLLWQQTMDAIEGAFTAISARVDEVSLFARLSAVETLAEAANDTAVTAQTQAVQATTASRETFKAIEPSLAETFDEFGDFDLDDVL